MVDGRAEMALSVSDVLRPAAPGVIQELHNLGVRHTWGPDFNPDLVPNPLSP